MSDIPTDIQTQADAAATLQADIQQKIAILKEAQKEIDATWKQVKDVMIQHDIKSIKGDWGSITIAERQNFMANMEVLPSKFIKKEINSTKVAKFYALEGKLPKGVERTTTKYLTKRIKEL